MILASGNFCHFIHIVLNDIRHCIIETVTCLFRLEENIRILCSTTCDGVFWIESPVTEILNVFHVDEWQHLFRCQ